MSFQQGTDFRSGAAYVTDPAGCTYEIGYYGNLTSYPRTTPQGNTVGYEPHALNADVRDRDNSVDPRLAGFTFTDTTHQLVFRIDLPAAGDYNIGLACGDVFSATGANYIELFDNTTSLGVLINGSTSGANRWLDATGTERTNVTWPTSNAMVTKTFASTILRIKLGNGSTIRGLISHLWVESAATGTTIAPGKGSVAFAGHASTVAQSANRTVAPGTGHVLLAGHVPSISAPANQTVQVVTGHIALTGHAPQINQGAGATLQLTTGHIAFAGHVPTVSRSANQVVSPAKGAISLAGKQPGVSSSANWVVNPSKGSIVFKGGVPGIDVAQAGVINPLKGSIVLRGASDIVVVQTRSSSVLGSGYGSATEDDAEAVEEEEIVMILSTLAATGAFA